jgi:predicted DNA-binding transcriptional regulator AlpA
LANTLPLPASAEPALFPAADPPAAGALPPLLLDTRDMCAVLRIGMATLHRLKAAGKLPRARKLAGLKWDAEEVRRWVTSGMPPLKEWEAIEAAQKRNGRPS